MNKLKPNGRYAATTDFKGTRVRPQSKVANKLKGITNKYLIGILTLLLLLALWQILCTSGVVPGFMLPTPVQVVTAFFKDFPLLMEHTKTTLIEALLGLTASIVLGLVLAVVMDRSKLAYKAFYPILIISQAVPVIAIAPLLVLWFGYDIVPKILLIILVCFFPIAINLYDEFKNIDTDRINLLKSMGATKLQQFWHIKLPSAMPGFLSSLKIAVTYSVVGAVISEWLGGEYGLGVYMQRVRNSYAFDKMFAVIFLIIIISIVLIIIVKLIEKRVLRYKRIIEIQE